MACTFPWHDGSACSARELLRWGRMPDHALTKHFNTLGATLFLAAEDDDELGGAIVINASKESVTPHTAANDEKHEHTVKKFIGTMPQPCSTSGGTVDAHYPSPAGPTAVACAIDDMTYEISDIG